MLNYKMSHNIYFNHDLEKNTSVFRAPDYFLKLGVADVSLGAKGVFMQTPAVFSLPSFYTRAFSEVSNLVLGKRKIAAHNRSHNLLIY